jgi:hypothetical protein
MFGKFSRSWKLVKASAAVLQSDKELLIFPIVSALAALLVAATFLLPIVGLRLFENGAAGPLLWPIGFLFYLCQYTVIFFFNTALVGAAMIRLDGGDPTVADGLGIARCKLGAILGYAAIAATVGILLKMLEQRAGFLGRIVIGLIGAAWTVATFMVVPVLVAQDVGPVEALKKSVDLTKKTWGENLIGNGSIGLAMGLAMAGVLAFGALLAVAAGTVSITLAIVIAAVAVLAALLLGVIQAALTGIYSAALYRYAVDGQAPAGFDGNALRVAFQPK